MCKEILKLRVALFSFVDYERVEPTNNIAERAIRFAVLWRKGSFGCERLRQSVRGALPDGACDAAEPESRPLLIPQGRLHSSAPWHRRAVPLARRRAEGVSSFYGRVNAYESSSEPS